MSELIETEVAVIGAGLSGLMTARCLTAAGREVLVLEAKDRVGGRTASRRLASSGTVIETGGQFAGPGQEELRALAGELGVGMFDVHAEGEALWINDGRAVRYDGVEPPLAEPARNCYRDAVTHIDELAALVPPAAPWRAPDAARLDRLTLAAWLLEHVSEGEARDAIEMTFKLVFGLIGERVSMLHALAYVAACGGWQQKMEGNSYRFHGGSHELSARMAAELGVSVRTGIPVKAIEHGPQDVVAHGEGLRVAARFCVVAMHPGDCLHVEYRPRLPGRREQLHRQWQSVSLIKAQAVYAEPFWRADGLSGIVQSDLGAAPFVYDNSPPDGSQGVLLTFLYHLPAGSPGGIPPEVEHDPTVRRTAVLEALASYFGPRALDPVEFADDDWLDVEYSTGCSCPTPPGLLTQLGEALTEPVGRIHWASSEASDRWTGWMAGAVVAGERAAREVEARLGQAAGLSAGPR